MKSSLVDNSIPSSSTVIDVNEGPAASGISENENESTQSDCACLGKCWTGFKMFMQLIGSSGLTAERLAVNRSGFFLTLYFVVIQMVVDFCLDLSSLSSSYLARIAEFETTILEVQTVDDIPTRVREYYVNNFHLWHVFFISLVLQYSLTVLILCLNIFGRPLFELKCFRIQKFLTLRVNITPVGTLSPSKTEERMLWVLNKEHNAITTTPADNSTKKSASSDENLRAKQ